MTPEAQRLAERIREHLADLNSPSAEPSWAGMTEAEDLLTDCLASLIPAGGLAEEAHSCKNCANWDLSDSYESALGLGICKATPMFWNSTEWNFDDADRPDGGRRWTANAEDKTAFVQDGSDYRAELYTKGEHSCSMFAAMAASTPQGKETP